MIAGMRVSLAIVGLGFLVAVPVAAQRLYSWSDEQGVMHYSSNPPAQPTQPVDELKMDDQGSISALPERESLYANQAGRALDADDEQRLETCAYYRSLLSRYQRKGATAFNPLTGQAELLPERAAAQAVQQAKYAVGLYCTR